MTHNSDKRLRDGHTIPLLGLGTWQSQYGDDAKQAVATALASGYRLIDTAAAYGNEASVGQAIAASDVPRGDIYVTTKLWNASHGYRKTIRAFHKSRKRLGLAYLDLYLIHWPLHDQAKLLSTWRAFEKLQRQGYIRSIGVSNFSQAQLQSLMDASKTPPAVNQIEVHPGFPQVELRTYCDEHGIAVQSWSPLGGSTGGLLTHSAIAAIADKHHKQPAQVIIRWHIQNDLIVIPKSVNPERIAANFDVFDFTLDDADMNAIAGLASSDRVGADPDTLDATTPTWLVQLAHRFGLVHWK